MPFCCTVFTICLQGTCRNFSGRVTDPLLSGLLKCVLHVGCIPHQNSLRLFWSSVCEWCVWVSDVRVSVWVRVSECEWEWVSESEWEWVSESVRVRVWVSEWEWVSESEWCECVSQWCVCEWVARERRRTGGGGRRSGYRTKNKNPTRQCGQNKFANCTCKMILHKNTIPQWNKQPFAKSVALFER